MNADGLFRGPDSEKEPGITQADLMKVLGHGQRDGDNMVSFDRRDSTSHLEFVTK
jgi:hypothetical protein